MGMNQILTKFLEKLAKLESKQEFTDAEYFEKIKEAVLRLEKVRIASVKYLETLRQRHFGLHNISKHSASTIAFAAIT